MVIITNSGSAIQKEYSLYKKFIRELKLNLELILRMGVNPCGMELKSFGNGVKYGIGVPLFQFFQRNDVKLRPCTEAEREHDVSYTVSDIQHLKAFCIDS